MGNTWRWLAVLALAAGLGFGCGSAHKSLQQAKDGLAQAGEAGAETRAAYEYYAAESYLNLAQHEFDETDHKQTVVYAEKSMDFSRQALEKAGGGAQ